ncbi:MAG: M15 family metallopeptidase [Bdellovibrionales bacterium]
MSSSDFVEICTDVRFVIDLRYASANNFVGRDMYGPFRRAFLHRLAAEKLFRAAEFLRQTAPGHRFLIYDALRPRSIQWVLWEHVRDTANQMYIANPDVGSLHNFGFAVDLTVVDPGGRELDMGAGYDDFRPVAQPRLEAEHLSSGVLSVHHINHRLILRTVMTEAGFTQLPHEWWHYDALPKEDVRRRFQIVE